MCSTGHPPYSHAAAGATWRVSFALLIPVVLYVFYYRVGNCLADSGLSRGYDQTCSVLSRITTATAVDNPCSEPCNMWHQADSACCLCVQVFVMKELKQLSKSKQENAIKGVSLQLKAAVVLAARQAWHALAKSATALLLLRVPHTYAALRTVWRLARCIPCSGEVLLRAGYDWVSARLLFTRFWHRLFGTAAIWFCNDWWV